MSGADKRQGRNEPRRVPSVAVIGGGIMGISTSMRLARAGADVTLYEAADHLGGLSTFFDVEGVRWDRFYHVILSTDHVMLDFLDELGLTESLFFTETETGFFGNGKLVSFSSIKDFIFFPFMSLLQKIRLAFGILYASRIENPTKLDRVYVRQWLTTLFGRRLYERIWDPLLRSKFGAARERTSAAFMWATIKRLYGARDTSEKQERMGHVHGGYRTILGAARDRLDARGVTVRLTDPVRRVDRRAEHIEVESRNGTESYDRVVLTTPCPVSLALIGEPDDDVYFRNMADVEYLKVICVVLVLRRSLSPYYVINLLDGELPFTGIIEATNVMPTADIGGRHLVYLPRYCPADSREYDLPDKTVRERFLGGLRRVFPDLSDDDIESVRVYREPYVQPLQQLNFLEKQLPYETPIEGVYVANTSMIYNSTLNNNAVITIGRGAADQVIRDWVGAGTGAGGPTLRTAEGLRPAGKVRRVEELRRATGSPEGEKETEPVGTPSPDAGRPNRSGRYSQ